MVFREVAWMTLTGMLAGLPMALALAYYSQTQLFGVQWKDPLVALAASIPARRAASTNPIEALRYE